MEAIGIKDRLSGWLAFATVALPIYLVGTLGLRVIGVPAILNARSSPEPKIRSPVHSRSLPRCSVY